MILVLDKPIGKVTIYVGNELNDAGRIQIAVSIKNGNSTHNSEAFLLTDKPAIRFNVPFSADGQKVGGILLEKEQYDKIRNEEDVLREPYASYIPEQAIWSIQERQIMIEYAGGHPKIEPRFITSLRSAISYYRSLAKSLSQPISSITYQKYVIAHNSMKGLVAKYADSITVTAETSGNELIIGFNICYRCGHAKITGKVIRGRSVMMATDEYRIVKDAYALAKREGYKQSPDKMDTWIPIFESKGYKVQIVSRRYCGC